MADTNLLVLAREYKKLREEVKKVLSMPKGDKGDQGEKGEKGDTGDTGPQGFPGRDGKDGINGYDGKDGRDGVDGKDGKDGLDGVGVSNAYIDFDNSLVIVLSDGREVNAGFLSQETKDNVVATFKQGAQTLNELLPIQTGNANKFLKTDGENVSWDTLDGSDINLASPPVIGNTTPNAATFTTLTATGQTSLGGAAGSESFRAVTTASSVNWLQATGAPANREPVLSAQGTDTNISMAFQSKGIGGISLSTGSIGTNLVNGTSVTAITRTATGSGYTSAPTVAISAPTTAGGVQATATVQMFASGGAVASGGSGYAVNDTVSITGFGSTITLTVTSVSAGAITAYTANSGALTSLPTNPVSQSSTSGSGTGATFNLTYGITTNFTITNAGSGYVEQPTVTFSGGGGSGAAAYATVGSAVSVKSLHNQLNFYAANSGIGLQVYDATGTSGASGGYWRFAQNFGTTALMLSSSTNGSISSGGAGNISFFTNVVAQEQLRVAHTASAVNYVQVTGAPTTTGAGVLITAQGSDTNLPISIGSKGTGYVNLDHTKTNFLRAQGQSTGVAPVLSAQGTDTNIGLNLITKGTGAVTFTMNTGTLTASYDTAGNQTFVSGTGNVNWSSTAGGSQRFFTRGTTAQQFQVADTASAVNFVQVTGAATGSPSQPIISAQGSDANINIALQGKGTGAAVLLDSGGGGTIRAIPRTTGGDTFLDVRRDVGFVDLIASSGVANGDVRFTPKGTGLVRFGTYTAGALSIAGYIEIKDAGGTVRRLAVVA